MSKKKYKGPKSKPSREEVSAALANLIVRTQICFSGTVDLLVSKKVFTLEELNSFLAAKSKEFEAAAQAPATPPNPES